MKQGLSGISIEIMLMESIYNTSAIEYFELNIGMNSIPSGTATVMHTGNSDVRIQSGEIGLLKISSTEHPELNDTTFTFIVRTCEMNNDAGGNGNKIIFSFDLGTYKTFETKTLQLNGTSVDTMNFIFNTFGYENTVNSLADTAIEDKMNWICVKNNMGDMLDEVIEHSFLEGDYIFYTFSTTKGEYKISSVNTEKNSKTKKMISYSHDSYNESDSASYTDDTTGYTVWWYSSLKKYNDIGKCLPAVYPNLVYSGFLDGKPDIGVCNNGCFEKLLNAAGYTNQAEITACIGGSKPYGPAVIIKEYPLNNANMYEMAPIIRNRYIATHAKKCDVVLTNAIGPDVGDHVILRANSNDRENNLGVLDAIYSDEYVVLSKTISKAKGKNNSDDVYVLVTLCSDHLLSGNSIDVADEFAKIQFPESTK